MPITESVRVRGIGGSEVGAILGLDPWRDAFAVWAAKHGKLEPRKVTPQMRFGSALEVAVLRFYEELTGREVEIVNQTQVHPARPYMVYTPDALVIGERRGVDAKYVAWHQRYKWGATAAEIPAYIRCQCMWYMAALEYEVWDVAAVVGDGDPLIYTVERDLETEAWMLEAVEEFWRRYILGDEIPPVGGSEESRRWLHERFPRPLTEEVRAALPEEVVLLEHYRELRILEKSLDPRRDELEAKLKAAVGDCSGLHWAGGRFTWKTTESAGVDWKGLASSILKAYGPEERAALEREYMRPGTRRIHFRAEGL